QEMRNQWVAMREYEQLPLVRVHGCSDVPRGLPLFETILVFENRSTGAALRAQGGKWDNRSFSVRGRTNFAVTVWAYAGPPLRVELRYDRRRIQDEDIRRMLGHLRTILESIAANPEQHLSEIPMLTEPERRQLLVEWNDTHADYPSDDCFHTLFEAQVE